MTNENLKENVQEAQQQVIAAQNQSDQFENVISEFAMDENVQDAIANSQQFEASMQQPTYEPNKPL